MNQIWENSEKPNFGLFGPYLGPKNTFCGFYLRRILDIVASYYCIQFQGKIMTQTQENDEKPHFGSH